MSSLRIRLAHLLKYIPSQASKNLFQKFHRFGDIH